ncbi:MAG: ribonuclease III [Candidatus Obscuribacterales bacterium]|nr:ribonuclease III [Candidatus Obscuribacterales bacterium]
MTSTRKISSERTAALENLQEKMAVKFSNLALLDEALTHSSYSHDHPQYGDYERLEFFGDAVLKFIVSEFLIHFYPKHDEGRLTEIRAVLINARTLEIVGQELGIESLIRVAKGVSIRSSMLARSMEAILGAIYLDQGMESARIFINRFFSSRADAVNQDRVKDNFKAQLQQLTQSRAQGVPIYSVLQIEGPPHDPTFIVAVSVGNQTIAQGTGHSKKAAEQEAAKAAYDVLCPSGVES